MSAKTHIFNIKTVDSSGEAKLTNRISIEAEIDVDDTLGTVRNLLAKDKKLDSGKARLAFCGKDGARVGDDMKWVVYETTIIVDTKGEAEGDIDFHDVYLELPEEKEKEKELSAVAQKVLDSDLDMDLMKHKPELIIATLKELASKYNHANFKAAVSKENVV
ncbi:hypothetical protein N7456_003108 [Penicillium angulare]|uniref:Ubiquitin-like domain-containing protein n=1 Tax=Penicillium angulare TaxID=116970 RepID=A0A9W9FU46_9EURO|nr:hypothetical protein N7456_003108 [Penicillium angulare]